MDHYDLGNAFLKHLKTLSFGTTYAPDELVPEKNTPPLWRRGLVKIGKPSTVGFGNGVYSRVEGFYQIDLYVDRSATNALKALNKAADAHATHFFPANGRGLTLIENQTAAHIISEPNVSSFMREGSFLRQMIEIDFYVEIPAAG